MHKVNKKWSGERIETSIFNLISIEHLHRYAFALEYIRNEDVVVDIACGEGYGTNLIAKKSKLAIGIDISKDVIEKAKKKYNNSNTVFKTGEASKIPIESNFADVVISFETIEHHDQHEKMLEEVHRVLKPGGIFIVSSPDKYFYSIARSYSNPFHVKELYEHEFKNIINDFFKHSIFFFQRAESMSFIFQEGEPIKQVKAYTGTFENISEDKVWGPKIWIAVASDTTIPKVEIKNFFIGKPILNELENQIRNTYLNSTNYRLGKIILTPLIFTKRIINIIRNL